MLIFSKKLVNAPYSWQSLAWYLISLCIHDMLSFFWVPLVFVFFHYFLLGEGNGVSSDVSRFANCTIFWDLCRDKMIPCALLFTFCFCFFHSLPVGPVHQSGRTSRTTHYLTSQPSTQLRTMRTCSGLCSVCAHWVGPRGAHALLRPLSLAAFLSSSLMTSSSPLLTPSLGRRSVSLSRRKMFPD